MAILETTYGVTRFTREKLYERRSINEYTIRSFGVLGRLVEIEPPRQIIVVGVGGKLIEEGIMQGENINKVPANLKFSQRRMPLGYSVVQYSYMDDDVWAAELEAMRPGLKAVAISDDGNERMLHIRHLDGTVSRTTVPTDPRVRPLYNPDGTPYGTPRQQ